MAKTTSWVFGIILILAGIIGFFSSPVLGFLAADTLSNIIHIVIGIVLLVLASKPSAVMTLKVVGIIYVILGLLGFLGWNFIAADSATNWFYLIIGIVIAALGWSSKGSSSSASSTPAPQM